MAGRNSGVTWNSTLSKILILIFIQAPDPSCLASLFQAINGTSVNVTRFQTTFPLSLNTPPGATTAFLFTGFPVSIQAIPGEVLYFTDAWTNHHCQVECKVCLGGTSGVQDEFYLSSSNSERFDFSTGNERQIDSLIISGFCMCAHLYVCVLHIHECVLYVHECVTCTWVCGCLHLCLHIQRPEKDVRYLSLLLSTWFS